MTDEVYRVLAGAEADARLVELERTGGRVRLEQALPVGADARRAGVAGRDAWALFAAQHERLWAFSAAGHVAIAAPRGDVLPLLYDGRACVAVAEDASGAAGPTVQLLGASDLAPVRQPWRAPASSRALLAATSTVYAPVAIFATDRPDEIDVCVAGGPAGAGQRTVSLGRGQRFECAAGGGTRVVVVSRGDDGLVVRTLASDLRSELNPVPLRPETGWTVAEARCVYANGPFVVAHAEHAGAERAVVVTEFVGTSARSSRVALPRLDALAVEARDLAIAALADGASAPILMVQRMAMGGANRRRYAYLLGRPRCALPEQRHAVLTDVAWTLAFSLGAPAPRDLALHPSGERGDVAQFTLPGPDAQHDTAVGLLLRDDGRAVATVRLGGGDAPVPRGLNFFERLRSAVTGDDDGDRCTTRLELPELCTSIESLISAIGALRAVR